MGRETAKLTGEYSSRLANISFCAMIGVVVIHCNMLHMGADGGSLVATAIRTLLSDTFVRASVPVFLFVSGFFLAYGSDFSLPEWRRALSKRLFTLLVPFIVWNCIYAILFCRDASLGDIVFVKILGLDYVKKPACMPFWYIKTLFGL